MADEIQNNEWTQLNPTTTPSYKFYPTFIETEFVKIDNQRNITNVDQTNQIADNHSQFIGFEMPRYFDHVDMSKMSIKIHYITPYDINAVVDAVNVSYNDNVIRFGWLLDTTITAYPGVTKFEIQAIGSIEDSEGNKFNYVWKSKPNGEISVSESLDTSDVAVTPPDTPYEQALIELNSIKTQTEIARDRAIEAANSADNAFTEKLHEAVTSVEELKEIVQKRTGVNTLDVSYNEAEGSLSFFDTTVSETEPFKVVKGIDSIHKLHATSSVDVEKGKVTVAFYNSEYTTPENLINSVEFSITPTDEWRNALLQDTHEDTRQQIAQYHEEAVIPINQELQKQAKSIEELQNTSSEAGVKKLVVDALPTEHISTDTIYFVPASEATTEHKYDAWMYVQYEEDGVTKYTWNLLGAGVDVDKFDKYYTKEEVEAKLKNAITASDINSFIENNATINSLLNDVKTNSSGITKTNQTVASLKTMVDKLNEKSQDYRYKITYGDTSADPKIPQFEGDAEDEDRRNHRLTLWEIEHMDEPNEKWVAAGTTIITGGNGGGAETTSTIIITRTDDCPSPYVVLNGKPVVLKFNYSDKDVSGQTVDAKGVFTIGNRNIGTMNLAEGENSFDVTKFMQVGTQKVTLTATDDNGTVASRSWQIQVVDIGLTSSFDDTLPRKDKAVSFTYTPNGAVKKTVHFVYDGVELNSVDTEVSGSLLSYNLPSKEYGSHLLETWITAKVGNTTVETEHIFKDIVIYDADCSHAVIGCRTQNINLKKYGRINLEFIVYDPSTETPNVSIAVDGAEVSVLKMDTNKDTYQYSTDRVGKHTVTFTCHDVVKTININVEDLDVDIQPIKEDLVFDFNPSGRSNASASDRAWKYNDEIGMTVSDNFDWQNGGYHVDANGDQYFLIKRGTRAVINYKMFEGEQTVDGKEFKIVFKTTNVQKTDATFLECRQGEVTPIGLKMDVHNAWLSSTANTLFAPYSENDIVEFDFNIAGSADEIPMAMVYIDGVAEKPMMYNASDKFTQTKDKEVPITIGSDYCDVYIYRMKAYKKSLSDKAILQNFIADARSAEEMLDRYYRNQLTDENKKLTPESVAEACPDLRIIKISAPHFTTSKKDFIKDTTIQCIYKNGDPVLDNWIFENAYHAGQGTTSDKYGASGRNIDLIACLNGNISINKKVALDPNYKSKLTLGDGTVIDDGTGKVTLTRKSVPNNWFNIKVNVASSENANNALLQKRYNDYLPYTPVAMEDLIEVHKGTDKPVTVAEFKADSNIETEMLHRSFVDLNGVKDSELHKIEASYKKNSMEFVNCVVFVQESDTNIDSHTEFNDTDWHFYAIGNIGDSKKTDSTRANDPYDMTEFCVEVSDNTLPNSIFPTGYTNEDGSVRYPVSVDEWSGNNGFVAVTDENLLIKENLPIFYEKIDGSYEKTKDTEIDATKTYYEIDYKSQAYKNLYVDEYRMNGSTVQQISGWDASFELRYADGGNIKDGSHTSTTAAEDKAQDKKSKEAFREFLSFIATATDKEFENHLKDYFIVDSALYYYLFTERYTMIDNRAKNCFYHYGKCADGKYRFELWAYDMDSALGINNSGEAVFPYGLESTDVGYSLPNGTTSTNPVFNAYNNVFWNRIREVFGKELNRMYQREESNKDGAFSAVSLINQFDAWQNQFPEELWRLDIERKYIRPTLGTKRLNGEYFEGHKPETRYLSEMMNGRKKYQRRQFERDQEKYMATKFFGLSAQNAHIMFRCSTPRDNIVVKPDYTLHVVPYADMYIDVEFGNTDPIQVRAKAGQTYDIPCTQETMDDTAIIIYQGDNISSVGDLSSMYIHDNAFGVGTHLTDLKIGSETKGYRNDGFVNLNLGENTLLKTLDIRNCAGLVGSLDLSKCENLEKLYAQGTNIAGVTFATNGQIKEIHTPEIASVVMKNLIYLTTLDTKGWSKLTSLVADNCGDSIDTKSIVENAPNLTTVRITNVDWSFDDAETLTRLYNMNGIDKNGKVISQSVLSGNVFVKTITQRDYNRFLARWTDINIKYETFIEQQTILFRNAMNADGSYDTLALEYWNIGTTPTDPTKANVKDESGNLRGDNIIPIPTKKSTESKNYIFKGWTPDFKPVVRGGNQIYTATYTESPRLYTVVYVNRDNTILQTTTECPYGSYVPYVGASGTYAETIVQSSLSGYAKASASKNLIPTYTAGELGDNFYLFKGWDISGYVDGFHKKDSVEGDIVITAQYDNLVYKTDSQTGRTPLENASGKIPIGDMTPIQLYTALQLNRKGTISLMSDSNHNNGWFALGDSVDIRMGKDISYENVESHEFISMDSPLVLNGTNYFDSDNNEADAKYGRFLSEDRDFVFAIEYSVDSQSGDNKVLMNLADNRNNGLKVMTLKGKKIGVNWWGASAPSDSMTGEAENITGMDNRELLILRHTKGSKELHIYSANTSDMSIKYSTRIKPLSAVYKIDTSLVLGAAKNDAETDENKKYGSFTQGTVYWAKIWMADLGDNVCRDLASWTHEVQTFQIAKSEGYYATNGQSTSFQLLSKYLLPKAMIMGSVSYSSSYINSYLNARVFCGFPTQWQAIIKSTNMESWDGLELHTVDKYGTTELRIKQSWTPMDTFVFLPSLYEVDNSAPAQYQRETGVNDRIKSIPILSSASALAGQWHPDSQETQIPSYWTRSLSPEAKDYFIYVDWEKGYGKVRSYGTSANTKQGIRMMISI